MLGCLIESLAMLDPWLPPCLVGGQAWLGQARAGLARPCHARPGLALGRGGIKVQGCRPLDTPLSKAMEYAPLKKRHSLFAI